MEKLDNFAEHVLRNYADENQVPAIITSDLSPLEGWLIKRLFAAELVETKISEILPFVSENFITFPLWEEGDFGPVVNVWAIFDTVPQWYKDTVLALQNTLSYAGIDFEQELDIKRGKYFVELTFSGMYGKHKKPIEIWKLIDAAHTVLVGLGKINTKF